MCIRDRLGAALLRNKQAPEAEQVFREDLERNPRNPRSLFGLSKALEARHKWYEMCIRDSEMTAPTPMAHSCGTRAWRLSRRLARYAAFAGV